MRDLLDNYLGQIEDPQLLAAIADLEAACGVSAADFEHMSLWSFLVQCTYPQGSARDRRPIDVSFLPHESVLEESLGSISGTAVFDLCECLLKRKSQSIEFFHKEPVVDVLNAMLPTFASSRSEDEVIDDVVRQRRLNRLG